MFYFTEILLKIEQNKMADALATLKAQWPEINKLDGEDFRYAFLDELYGKLFKKQEQLQATASKPACRLQTVCK